MVIVTACIVANDSFVDVSCCAFADFLGTATALVHELNDELSVTGSIFLRCMSCGASSGGAISKSGNGVDSKLTLKFSCFSECRNSAKGMAIILASEQSGMIFINETNFAVCGGSDISSSQGTLLLETGSIPATFYNINFTNDFLSSSSGTGSAFQYGAPSSSYESNRWDMHFCTFLRCSGKSVIQSDRALL
jgi:hypothetical protein